MIYLAFFKSLITTIKPIFFRFFSIIKYLVLALLAILLYMLVGRVGAWNIWDVASIVEFQYNDTWHNRWLEHIDYSANMLSRGDAYYITTTEKQNPLRYNYSYAKWWYKVLYDNNSLWWIFAFKKWTFTHTIGYPYWITWFAKIEIPTNWFLWWIANIFSSKKFKNLVVNNNWFIFFNENENDLEINSHVCGKEFPWYYFMHIIRHQPLKVFDFKNKLVYEYDSVPSLKNWPNSWGCWILPYLEQEADRVYKFTYSSNRNYWWSLFVSNAYYTTTINHTNWNFRLILIDKNQLNQYKRSYRLWEQISEKKIPEQYQAEHEKEKDQYQSSPAYFMCQKDYEHYKLQTFGLQQCILSNTWNFDPFPAIKDDILNFYKSDFATGANIWVSYYSYLLNWQSPFQYVDPSNIIGFCKIWVAKENQFYLHRVGWWSLRTVQYAEILNKQLSSLNTWHVFPNYISEDDYCSYNPKYIGTTNDWIYSWFLDKLTDKLVSFISSEDFQNNLPDFLSPIKKYFDNYFNIENKDIVPWLVNYCKEWDWYTVANILYIMILLSILFIIYKFTL